MEASYFKDYLVRRYANGRIPVTIRDVAALGAYTPSTNYLIIDTSPDLDDELRAAAELRDFREPDDYFSTQRYRYGVAEDFEFEGVTIGRYSYINFAGWMVRNYVSSVGRHTSINATARIERDHPLNMITTNHRTLFDNVFCEEDREYAHSLAAQGRKNPSNKIKIGNDVWIGANAFINCSRVSEIGDGAIIGTGAVVLEDVPPYAIVVGVPGRVKKYRYAPEQIEILQRVKWWDWDEQTLRRNARLLLHPERFFEEFK